MKSSVSSARGAGSVSINHRFPWRWNLADLAVVEKNGLRVFSTFACGGGSSMGYKLAGFDVVGCLEIDPQMMKIYKTNHHPEVACLMDIREAVEMADELPDALHNIDVLDGSPPCSVFSMAGDREKAWGKEKRFREGQKEQRLDDLFFSFVALAEKLRPKVVVAENVKGLVQGNARGYVREIVGAFDRAGYEVQIFLLNAAKMGVPQARERVFFIGQRKDLEPGRLRLSFNEPPVCFGEIRSEKGKPVGGEVLADLARYIRRGDRDLSDVARRVRRKDGAYFSSQINWDEEPSHTITAGGLNFRGCDGMAFSDADIIAAQTFPKDFDFCGASVQYVCGMSVPPVMMANVAAEIARQVFGR